MSQLEAGGFKDHFSGHAAAYARYRPAYPAALYDWLASQCAARELAWDVATGNGQAAVELAGRFRRVIATDGSAEQIAHARHMANIEYRVETAETSSLNDHSVDLITVAQAYHWFDHDAFVAEAARVLKPGGLLAIWTYALAEVKPGVDRVVREFYSGPIGPYWPPERKLVETAYRSLQFPWPEIAVPEFVLRLQWSLDDLLGYLRTWSAVQRYIAEKGDDPVSAWQQVFVPAWGEQDKLTVSWPLKIRCFRLDG